MCPRVALLSSLSPTAALYTPLFLPSSFILLLLFFLLAEFYERESFAGLSGLEYQLPLLLAPRATESELKCLQFRPGRSLSHQGRAGSPERGAAHLPGLIGQNDDVKLNLSLEKC